MFQDFSIFRQIEPTEYIDDLFELPSRYGTPMLEQFAALVNREMFWVVTEVCSEHNPVRRMKIIKQFIKVASMLLAKNYDLFGCNLLLKYRTMQGMQEFQFNVCNNQRFGSWSSFET